MAEYLQQLLSRRRQKINSSGELCKVVEHGVLEADLTCPPLEQIEVFSEHHPAVLLVEAQFPSLFQQGVEHGGVDEEEDVRIELRQNLDGEGGRGEEGGGGKKKRWWGGGGGGGEGGRRRGGREGENWKG